MSDRQWTTGAASGGPAGDDAFDAVSLVDDLLRRAQEAGASDVHFEPTASGLIVRFRLDGLLQDVERLPRLVADRAVTRLKVLAGLLTYRNDIPQEGRLADGLSGPVQDRRLAVFPTIHGQRAVVRLFYRDDGLWNLDGLGLPAGMAEPLRRLALQTDGLVLLTGPAGSGKSTTLRAMLDHIVRCCPGRSVVALEDPVERHIEGVSQVQISPHGEMTFPRALRSILRQDPQVLMIGEIRDDQTARIAVEAALTGHLLLSTLHSGSPASALLRLLEMGIEPYQVTSSVLAVVNQRLVRRLCPSCRVPAGEGGGAFEPAGCERCFRTGYRGRALLAEMVLMDAPLRQALLGKADASQVTALLRERGHRDLLQAGRTLVEGGTTSNQELARVCGSQDIHS